MNSTEEFNNNRILKTNVAYVVSIDGNRTVAILEPQQSKVQQFFRKLGIKIPYNKQITLEGYGSFIFLLIDGERSVYEIGQLLEEKYGEATAPLYPRLNLFLHYLENAGYLVLAQ